MIEICSARTHDAESLTELTLRSKNYWNYGEDLMAQWRDELTITGDYIRKNSTFKILKNKKVIGFYSFSKKSDDVVKLDNLFIDPDYIGQGFGKLLFTDFKARVTTLNFKTVTLDADPNAELFYKKLGFKVVGKLPSIIKNRFLPVMELELS